MSAVLHSFDALSLHQNENLSLTEAQKALLQQYKDCQNFCTKAIYEKFINVPMTRDGLGVVYEEEDVKPREGKCHITLRGKSEDNLVFDTAIFARHRSNGGDGWNEWVECEKYIITVKPDGSVGIQKTCGTSWMSLVPEIRIENNMFRVVETSCPGLRQSLKA